MNINQLNINNEAETTIQTSFGDFKCLNYIPADKFGDILVDSVTPLFYREQGNNTVAVDILQPPKTGERYILAHKDVYFVISLVKNLTNIEVDDGADINGVYNKIVSNEIDRAVINNLGAHYHKLRWIVDTTIESRIEQINKLKK